MTQSEFRQTLRRLAFVLVVCTACGTASMAVAPPDQLWAPVNVAAGVALACVLGWGSPVLPAVVLAVMAAWLIKHGGPAPGVGWGLYVLVLFGAGLASAVQARLAAMLVRRFVAQPLALEQPADIARFLLVAAPLPAVAGALLATGTMVAAGVMPGARWLVSAELWWLGDTLGVLVGAPIMLTVVGRPKAIWHSRRLTVGLPLLLITLALAASLSKVQSWDEQRQEAVFSKDADSTASGMQLRVQGYLDALAALHGVYIASNDVSRSEFTLAADYWVRTLHGLQAVGWHELVPLSQLAVFEQAQRDAGLVGFRVMNRDHQLVAHDAEALVMRYVEPPESNHAALGINVLSIPAAREAAMLGRRTGRPTASAGFQLMQEVGHQSGIVVYMPVYRHEFFASGQAEHGSPQARLDATRGMVFVTLRMDDALAAAVEGKPAYVGACLLDVSTAQPGDDKARLAGAPDCKEAFMRAPARLTHRVALPFAGRNWELCLWARGPVPVPVGRYGSRMLAGVGVLMAASLGAMLLVITGRTRQVEAAVAERTGQLQSEVAERRRTEAALRDSEQRFRSIFDNVPIGVLYADDRGFIRQANPALALMSGCGEAELSGAPLHELVHPDDRPLCDALVSHLRDLGHGVQQRELRFLTREGLTRQVRLHLRSLEDGDSAGMVGVVEDITQRKQLLEAERARELAEAANRAKTDFLSRMSHELRTPLNAMLGFAQLMAMDPQDPLSRAQRERVGQIETAGWHLLEMINDVLDLSRIEAGTIKLAMQTLSIAEAVNAALVLVEPMARRNRIDIQLALDPDAYVLGDPTRLRQILTNLLTNAIKYNRSEGSVRVATRALDSDRWGIDVTDDGLGMSTEQMAGLFQPFNRLGRERSATEGSGIGLVISLRLAQMMGGDLGVRSREGRGSTFTLALHRAGTPTAGDALLTMPGMFIDSGYHQRRVVYVEDNAANAEVMRGILRQRPQIVLEIYGSGRDGLEAICRNPPSLVLLDLHLPDLSGCDVLRELRRSASAAAVPVVVVSADVVRDQIDQALALGAFRFVTKPVDVDDLLATVDQVLREEETVW